MLQSTSVKIFTFGLMLLLTACSSAAAGQPAPVMDKMPATTAANNEMVKKSAAPETLAEVKEKPAAAEEAMAESNDSMPAVDKVMPEMMASPVAAAEAMTKVKESQPDEAMAQMETAPMAEEPEMMESKSAEAASMKDDAVMTPAQAQLLASLKNQGTPPELSNEVWLNSQPLKLADLHGKVVIVEFWTFGCINCKHVVPTLRQWHQTYQDEGLVIIGVHTPEFDYERDVKNVKQALLDQDIPYAVAIDNDWATWRAYNNRYWPAKYFIDKTGQLRHIAIGEGHYEQQEEIIQALLAEKVM